MGWVQGEEMRVEIWVCVLLVSLQSEDILDYSFFFFSFLNCCERMKRERGERERRERVKRVFMEGRGGGCHVRMKRTWGGGHVAGFGGWLS